jgi:ubiquinone/menaquinone biosynthesis C-methylase UbiE
MGLYRDHVVPRLVDVACGTSGLARWRQRATEGLFGEVVEIGFGAGRNVPFYPEAVRIVYAVEPSAASMKMAYKRNAASRVKIQHVGLDGGSIQLDDESCDGALMTFTLCTVSDPQMVLSEIRRVLRPGGQLHFLEHGLAPEASIAKWQHRLDPWERRLADGCHLTRDARSLVSDAGFSIRTIEQRYARGPKPWSYFTFAVASKD